MQQQKNRVLAVKLDIAREQFQRLRDLGWQAAHFRTNRMIAKFVELKGYRLNEEQLKSLPDRKPKSNAKKTHPDSITRLVRQEHKGELSGAAYAACEREVDGAWSRKVNGKPFWKFLLAGSPLPQWKPTAALSVRGHKNRNESGIRLEIEGERHIAYLQAQSKDCEGGSWLRLPVTKNERRDEHQGPILNRMVAWEVPILKAQVVLSTVKRKAILRLTYEVSESLPAMGERVATLGMRESDGALLLRTETQTKDYRSKLEFLLRLKDNWDLIRRRIQRQVGRRKGHARIKRLLYLRQKFDQQRSDPRNAVQTFLHQWSREIADWCNSQGVGTIRVVGIDTGDWPAHRFVELLKYKAAEHCIKLDDKASLADESTHRAASAAIKKQQRKAKRAREAVVDLEDHFGFKKRKPRNKGAL